MQLWGRYACPWHFLETRQKIDLTGRTFSSLLESFLITLLGLKATAQHGVRVFLFKFVLDLVNYSFFSNHFIRVSKLINFGKHHLILSYLSNLENCLRTKVLAYLYLFYPFLCIRGGRNGWVALKQLSDLSYPLDFMWANKRRFDWMPAHTVWALRPRYKYYARKFKKPWLCSVIPPAALTCHPPGWLSLSCRRCRCRRHIRSRSSSWCWFDSSCWVRHRFFILVDPPVLLVGVGIAAPSCCSKRRCRVLFAIRNVGVRPHMLAHYTGLRPKSGLT